MPKSIIRECGRFNITPELAEPTAVTVGETWRKIPRYSRPFVTHDLYELATKVRPYLQHTGGETGATELAQHMASERGWSVAYYGDVPNHVLAFGALHALRRTPIEVARRQPKDYIFGQFGVTADSDLSIPHTNRYGIPSEHYLRASAALLHCAIDGLDNDSTIFINGYPQDTRSGHLFRQIGFRIDPDNPNWGRQHTQIGATVGEINTVLPRIPEFSFLAQPTQAA